MLQSLETGTIRSKREAVTWAQRSLDPRWRALVEDAWSGRADLPRGEDAVSDRELPPADPVAVAQTRAFIAYALRAAADGPGPSTA
jgi:hypothetical protein